MIRSVDSLASFHNCRSVGYGMSAGVQEASMLSVPQFLPSGQSARFTRSASESWIPSSAAGSQGLSSSDNKAPTSISLALLRSATSSLIRLRCSSVNRYTSRRLRLAEINHHGRGEWRLNRIARKTKEKLHVRILANLLASLLIGLAEPLLDEQRAKRHPHRLRWGASRGVEPSGIGFFQL